METQVDCRTKEVQSSQMLQNLVKQLQFPAPTSPNLAVLEKDFDDNKNGTELESMDSVNQFSAMNFRKSTAAVLICLFEGNEGELRVVLTKRSMRLSSYPGDVALPGGKMEEEDADYSATALREAMEEIGLDPDLVQVVAYLEPFITQHQLKVVPVVGLLSRIKDFKPLLNRDEVDAAFDVPLEMFLKGDENYQCQEREWMGWKYVLHLFKFESDQGAFLICGLTASILIRAATVVYQRSPSFSHHLPDFQQLHKSLNNIA